MVRSAFAVLLLAAPAAADPPAPDLRAHEAVARKFEQAIRADDVKAARAMFDRAAFEARVLRRMEGVPAKFRDGFVRGVGDSADRVVAEYARVAKAGGGFKLLRVRVIDGEPRALFRLLPDDGGVNYSDVALSPGADPKVVDVHVALSGEPLSRTFGRLGAVGAAEVAAKAGQPGGADEILATAAAMKEAAAMTRAGRHRDALAAIDRLPARVRGDKTIVLRRVITAAKLIDDDPDVYLAAVADYRKRFPDDPAADLVGFDGLLLTKRYADCYRALDRLDKAFADPYLSVMRANVLLQEGKPGDARKAAARAVAAEPDLVPAHWALVEAALAEKDHRETARLLTHLETKLGAEIGDLAAVEAYKEFVKSSEYRAWAAARKKP